MGAVGHSTTLNDFYKAYDFVNYILTALGLSFVGRNPKDNKQYAFSFRKLCYGVLIFLLILFVFYQQMYWFYPEELDNVVLLLLYLYIVVVGTLMALIMVSTAMFMAPALAKILNDPEFYELFTLYNTINFIKVYSFSQLVFGLTVLLACYIADLVSEPEVTPLAALKIFLFFFFPMYNSFCISQFFNVHYWLQRLYWSVNESLAQILSCHWPVDGDMFMFGILEMERSFPKRMSKAYTIEDNIRVNVQKDDDKLVSSELIRLRRIYLKTHKVTKLLNQAFSARNILLLIHHCALETIYTYWGLRHILENLDVSLTAKLNFFKAAFMSFVSVVSMVWPCTTTRVELQIFTLQLIQHKYDFSPYGFFDINNQLILGFLGTMASYLIILLQYHMVNIALQANRNTQPLNGTFAAIEFPRDKELNKKWLIALRRSNWEPSENSKLCSLHFDPKFLKKRNGQYYLLRDAIPTIFSFTKLTKSNEMEALHSMKRRKPVYHEPCIDIDGGLRVATSNLQTGRYSPLTFVATKLSSKAESSLSAGNEFFEVEYLEDEDFTQPTHITPEEQEPCKKKTKTSLETETQVPHTQCLPRLNSSHTVGQDNKEPDDIDKFTDYICSTLKMLQSTNVQKFKRVKKEISLLLLDVDDSE